METESTHLVYSHAVPLRHDGLNLLKDNLEISNFSLYYAKKKLSRSIFVYVFSTVFALLIILYITIYLQ